MKFDRRFPVPRRWKEGASSVSSGVSEVVHTDLCIVGAGPAGITLARELLGTGITICLVESGGETVSAAAQELARGETFGDPTNPPDVICKRAFGGTSHAWHIRTGQHDPNVRHLPFAELDFEERSWVRHSGWPICRASIEPYYNRAQAVCGLRNFEYGAEAWEDSAARRLPLDPAVFETTVYQFGPAAIFHRSYRQELRAAERTGLLRVLTKTTALRLTATADRNQISHVVCGRDDGTRLVIAAKIFVLATGGFQNARLLLMSNDHDPSGIGNAHDLVGRYYHDHPLVYGGALVPDDPGAFAATSFYDIRHVRGTPVMAHLRLSTAAQRRHHLHAISTSLFPRPSDKETDAVEAFRDLLHLVKSRTMPRQPLGLLRRLVRRPHATAMAAFDTLQAKPLLSGYAEGGWSRQRPRYGAWQSFHLYHQVEQTPDPANRVTLGAMRDRFGSPTLEVHWRWLAEDMDSVARAQQLLATEFRRAGIGTFHIARRDGQPDLLRPSGTHHLMGTTRMHPDPRRGVVDVNCQVHGVSNLFIAGSSVFPTGGYANPTLTIVAMALRLAEHVEDRLRAGVTAPATVQASL